MLDDEWLTINLGEIPNNRPERIIEKLIELNNNINWTNKIISIKIVLLIVQLFLL